MTATQAHADHLRQRLRRAEKRRDYAARRLVDIERNIEESEDLSDGEGIAVGWGLLDEAEEELGDACRQIERLERELAALAAGEG
jgi:hypothetical protein